MSALRVFIETSVVSYLTALPSRDLVQAAHQQIIRIEAVCRDLGYRAPVICTPEELMLGEE